MIPPADNPAHLSVHRAYAVQFQSDTVVEQGHLVGRVEHVVSGQSADFQSLEALLMFIEARAPAPAIQCLQEGVWYRVFGGRNLLVKAGAADRLCSQR